MLYVVQTMLSYYLHVACGTTCGTIIQAVKHLQDWELASKKFPSLISELRFTAMVESPFYVFYSAWWHVGEKGGSWSGSQKNIRSTTYFTESKIIDEHSL